MKSTFALILICVCVHCYAGERGLTPADQKAAATQMKRLLRGDASLYSFSAHDSGCYDLDPCTDVVERYATFERPLSEPGSPVIQTARVQCSTPPKVADWKCVKLRNQVLVPKLSPHPLRIDTGSLHTESAALADADVFELVRYILSSCYEDQKRVYDAKHPRAPVNKQASSIGFDSTQHVYTAQHDGPFWSYTMLIRRIEDKGRECPFEIVGERGAVY